ncbi:hypothetical protein [Bradyrhizobium sp.]|uniref:hypothetical protein n=1 Tax=Bradyrhizobium sp. TaxID=376 RepID=UPI003C5376CB
MAQPMEQLPPARDDRCPHCHVPLEIVAVRIGLARVSMDCICPNCGMVQPHDPAKAALPPKERRKRGASLFRKRQP